MYYRAPNSGPDCSTERSRRLRERRFQLGYAGLAEPRAYTRLAEEAKAILLSLEEEDLGLARARALLHVVEQCEINPEPDAVLLGGENPFFFNLLLPALQADRHSREGHIPPDEDSSKFRAAGGMYAACFEGHITPGIEFILGQGVAGLERRLKDQLEALDLSAEEADSRRRFWESGLLACQALRRYAECYRQKALRLAKKTSDAAFAAELLEAAAILEHVPERPARTLREALQSFWLAYILVTTEMGGCCPGGGIGLGRPDQYLRPYYERDLMEGRLTREQALELMEVFLIAFRHEDYFTPHQFATPGSQASLGGITPLGQDAWNPLTELILEASLRLQFPTPYLSLRLHKEMSDHAWQVAANYLLGGLGFPIVNDEVLIPAFLKHGRALYDARDYICSCCYEHTIPGREAFHPNGAYLNLPLVLELALTSGRSLLSGEQLGPETKPLSAMESFDEVVEAFLTQLGAAQEKMVRLVNATDASHCTNRRYPLMSVLMEDCIGRGKDVCAGGARYNLTGCIVAGLPNVVNSLAALMQRVFEQGCCTPAELLEALERDFEDEEELRRLLLSAPKWGNGETKTDALARLVTDRLYEEYKGLANARGGRWQLALYSFMANWGLGEVCGASADGRPAREHLTRNLNPTWGTDLSGPTAVLSSLSAIDFTQFPDGSALDLRFDPRLFETEAARESFVGFLKAFVDLGVMEMQLSFADAETLRAAREYPEQHQHVMVRVAGYSARFIDLEPREQEEVINRTEQAWG